MLKMSQVNYIRDLHNSGYRISEITRGTSQRAVDIDSKNK